MAIVREDIIGLYVACGGYIARPSPGVESVFQPGDRVKTYHHGGSTAATISLNGEREYWHTQSMMTFQYNYAKKYFATEEEFNQAVTNHYNMRYSRPGEPEWDEPYRLWQEIKDDYWEKRRAKWAAEDNRENNPPNGGIAINVERGI